MIFAPGFSTAAAVTDLSGRGVGMDVVKKNIEHIKGRIEIINELGKGCSFIIRIPLTLATIEGMLISVGSTKYTIPITTIRESLRPEKEMITIRPDGQEFVKIRDLLLPVFRLYELHDLTPRSDDLSKGILIVLDLYDGSICLFVDEILHQVQTVIKSLSTYLGKVKGISGCNILGNGEVALIIDPESILRCLPADLKCSEVG
jgi:two-component system chemotaxis sensor kinase CheA